MTTDSVSVSSMCGVMQSDDYLLRSLFVTSYVTTSYNYRSSAINLPSSYHPSSESRTYPPGRFYYNNYVPLQGCMRAYVRAGGIRGEARARGCSRGRLGRAIEEDEKDEGREDETNDVVTLNGAVTDGNRRCAKVIV